MSNFDIGDNLFPEPIMFDPNQVEAPREFAPLPPGKYNVRCEKAGVRETSTGNGKRLALEFSVIDGPHANRRVFGSLNMWHKNPTVANIGRQDFAAMASAMGLPAGEMRESHLLVGKTCTVRLAASKDPNFPDPDIKGFEAMRGGAPAAPPSAQPAQPSPPVVTGAATPASDASTPPWARAS